MLTKIVDGVVVPLTEEEEADFVQREQDHAILVQELALTQYQKNRRNEYPALEDMIVALVEDLREGRPEALQALMAKRAIIKAKYPKPI
jgi:hypothetical protein